MIIHPMTVEEALEYAPKAALLDFDGPVTPDFIAAMREHLSYAISALGAVSSKLYEAEAAILDLHESNVELAELLRAASSPTYQHPSLLTLQKVKKMKSEWDGGIDPEYGTQMSFDDVPSREPIDVIEAEAFDTGGFQRPGRVEWRPDPTPEDPGRQRAWYVNPHSVRGETTVEFRTDPGTYDANRGEIHRMLAEEIVATFGDKSGDNDTLPPGQS